MQGAVSGARRPQVGSTTERGLTVNDKAMMVRGQLIDQGKRVARSNRSAGAAVIRDPWTRVSTLWVVLMLNMIFADILSFMVPGTLQAAAAGQVGMPVTQGLLLVFAVLLEIPIAMIVASRVLAPRTNRWANTVAAVITTAFVVGGGSPYLHYWFFETVQIACMALIVWSVWSRRTSAGAPEVD